MTERREPAGRGTLIERTADQERPRTAFFELLPPSLADAADGLQLSSGGLMAANVDVVELAQFIAQLAFVLDMRLSELTPSKRLAVLRLVDGEGDDDD